MEVQDLGCRRSLWWQPSSTANSDVCLQQLMNFATLFFSLHEKTISCICMKLWYGTFQESYTYIFYSHLKSILILIFEKDCFIQWKWAPCLWACAKKEAKEAGGFLKKYIFKENVHVLAVIFSTFFLVNWVRNMKILRFIS